ncbi:MAG: calcium-binding protein, partial [Chloroflexi bacterium]
TPIIPHPPPPNVPPPEPVDTDGDGVPDIQDICPYIYGDPAAQGCPLPNLPTSGPCVAATDGGFRVNIREGFSQFSDVTGQMDLTLTYGVLAQATVPPEDEETGELLEVDVTQYQTWYLLENGWVAGLVTRIGGECDDVPELFIPVDDPTDEPPTTCDEPINVVFESFDDDDRHFLPSSIAWRLNYADVIVTGNIYIGTDCDEYIFGSPSSDIIIGNGGDDWIFSLGGNDTLSGGAGDDHIYSGWGNDVALGGDGNDHINGNGNFNEPPLYLYEGGDNDRLYGQNGNDSLFGNRGHDWLYGQNGNDSLLGGQENDRLFGASGNDRLDGNWGADLLLGSTGNDRLAAYAYNHDVLRGGIGDDWIYYTQEINYSGMSLPIDLNTIIEGNEGDDTFFVVSDGVPTYERFGLYQSVNRLIVHGNEGNDTFNGAGVIFYGDEGDDTFRFGSRPHPSYGSYNRNMVVAFGGVGDDEFYVARYFSDYTLLFGEDGDDYFWGGPGRDYIFGGNGADYARGYRGADYIYGDNGNDELYGYFPRPDSGYWTSVDHNNYLDGGGNDDILVGGPSNEDVCRTGLFESDSASYCEERPSWSSYDPREDVRDALAANHIEYAVP